MTLRSWGVFEVSQIPIATGAHMMLIDLLAVCVGPFDEQVLRLRLNAATQQDIASALGRSQQDVSRSLAGIYARAYVKDEDDPVRLGMALRGSVPWRSFGAEVLKSGTTGLRYAKHTLNHKSCCAEVA